MTRLCRWVVGTGVTILLGGVVVLVAAWNLFPVDTELIANRSRSPEVKDCTGFVSFEQVSENDEWCFPIDLQQMSPWLIQATIAAEDQRFLEHCGVDVSAVFRASLQNTFSGKVVSGASTISMQLCRIANPRARTFTTKLIEAAQAIQLETRLSKRQILEAYLNSAPYGGNIRGVEAAARRYFDKSAKDLSLAEATLLAGLPQSPTRYRPDRSLARARTRQRFVLERMKKLQLISEFQFDRALNETIVVRRRSHRPLSHWIAMALRRRPAGGQTTINSRLQDDVQSVVDRHLNRLSTECDVAVVLIEIATSEIHALIGSPDYRNPVNGQVNGATARRSPGSTLKPFIYAAAFDSARLSPQSVVNDVPIRRAGWKPQNFDRDFAGEMTVGDALRSSRNVPAILIMEQTGVARCIGTLNACGIELPTTAEDKAGLSVSVGSSETSLLQLTNGYATLGRTGVAAIPRLFQAEPIQTRRALSSRAASAVNAILASTRQSPNFALGTEHEHVFMWKTGTSSGRRDAWAVGHNGRYAIGVWVGRFSGPGHTLFVGRTAAEPILAELMGMEQVRASYQMLRRSFPEDVPTVSVIRPIVFQRLSKKPTIRSPENGATYLATEGLANVPVECGPMSNQRWFLNGRLLAEDHPQTLRLPPGRYRLHCQFEAQSCSVTFRVADSD